MHGVAGGRAEREEAHELAEHELLDRPRPEEDGQADQQDLAHALEDLKVEDAELCGGKARGAGVGGGG